MHATAITNEQADRDADRGVTALYLTHYRPLVRLAALLVRDLAAAEDIVQDSFVALHAAWHTVPDAVSYLRQSVVYRSRSVPQPAHAGRDRDVNLENSPFISAMWSLPARQREVMVLRYFADLPETQIASVTGLSTAAVKSHTARAMSALHVAIRGRRQELADPASH